MRKTLGGGMRQVGILCAAALVALQENVAKLEGDHKKAKTLAGIFSVYLVHYPNFPLNFEGEPSHLFSRSQAF